MTLEADGVTDLCQEDLEDFFMLLPRIYCDYRNPRRGTYELVYIFSETPDNEGSTFIKAAELANEGATKNIGIAEGDLGHGYMGFDHSVRRLKDFGLNMNEKVPVVKFDVGGNVNTLSEARLLAKYAQSVNGDIGIIAPPFHLVRAFMTTITALSNSEARFTRVYAIPGISVPWMQQVAHSQGTLRNTRAGLLSDELARLEKYRAPEFGGLLSAETVLKYLDWRDF